MPRIVTGIKPTGEPHLGDLAAMLCPTVAAPDHGDDLCCFIADLHALNVHPAPAVLQSQTAQVARLLVALGLAERASIYRQSDVPSAAKPVSRRAAAPFSTRGWVDPNDQTWIGSTSARRDASSRISSGAHRQFIRGTYGDGTRSGGIVREHATTDRHRDDRHRWRGDG